MSGLTRYIRILRLFDEAHGDWTVPDMAQNLRLPASTVYRTVREMVSGGLLEAANERYYRLGGCFIEFDRIIRVTDPLYEIGAPLLNDLVSQARVPCVAVLARLYNDTVMCVADAAAADAHFITSLERGQARPLTRGATSKVILAQLPSRRLTRLLEDMAGTSSSDPDPSRVDFRKELAAIRRRGFSITRGEVHANLVGISAPVSLPARGLLGSLSLIMQIDDDDSVERRLAMLVMSTAGLLTDQLIADERKRAEPPHK